MSTLFTTYDFNTQLKKGEDYESQLDEYYSEWYEIQEVSMQAQKLGVDRVWTDKKIGYRYSVQYKADETASRTNNVFIETMSVDNQNTLGWAYTSIAELLLYYIPPNNIVYMIPVLTVKYLVEVWKDYYEIKTIPNDGYNTIGLTVPIEEFAKHCHRTDTITFE